MLIALLFSSTLWADLSSRCTGPAQYQGELQTQDVPYQPWLGDKKSQKLDIHIPRGASPPYKTVMLIHGGCFTKGSKWDYDSQIQIKKLNEMGYAVASVDYRLASDDPSKPRAGYPDALNDVRDALCYLKQHGKDMNLDTERIPAAGYSAGGTLALYLATRHRAGTNYKTKCDTEPMPSMGLILNPRTDMLQSTEKLAKGKWDCGEKFVGMKRNEKNLHRKFREADVLSHLDVNNTVPLYIAHGNKDTSVNYLHSDKLCKALPSKCKLVTIEGANHQFYGPNEMAQAQAGICQALADFETVQSATVVQPSGGQNPASR